MKMASPPTWPFRFLRWFCPPALYESVEGDLLEAFDEDVEKNGIRIARLKFIFNVARFFRPGIILRNSFTLQLINTIMLGNYAKVALRNMRKRKLYTFINAFGLSIGIAFCLLIYLFIEDERSFDQFHVNKERIYRIEEKSYDTWKNDPTKPYNRSAYIQTCLQPVLKEEVPEVQYATRFTGGNEAIMMVGEKIFTEKIAYVDADFFKIFSFPLLSGNADKIFQSKEEVVLTPAIATKYFGSEDPLGKTIVLDREGERSYTVVGMIEPAPFNSSIDYSILIPQGNHPYFERNLTNWGSFNTNTLVQLHTGSTAESFAESLAKIVEKYMKERTDKWAKEVSIDPNEVVMFEYTFTQLPGVHLNKDIQWHKVSDPKYSYILGGIALLILVIACINYISLALTTSASRRMEVGVRKAAGAQRNQILYQFGLESIITALVSALLGVCFVVLFLPVFNDFTLKNLELSNLLNFNFIAWCLGSVMIVGMLAGGYPALFLSRFKPAAILKGNVSSKFSAGFTKPLVVLQFFLSACLIISSVIMYKQMHFISTKELGFNKDQMLVIPTQMGWNQNSNDAVEAYRARLEQEPEVLAVAGTSTSFNHGWSRYGYKIGEEQKAAYVYAVDTEYIPTLDLELVEGRNFDPARASDSVGIIVNEALVRDMGWENPLEEYLNWREDSIGLGSPVIGVVKDYHFLSLEQEIGPLFLSMDKERVGYLTTMLVKVSSTDIPETIKMLESTWKELYPNKPFEYSFLDEDVAKQYASHERWMKIMGLSTGLAILIACLGLFGLSGINSLNKTKEIGIRKIMGAELGNIFFLLNREYFMYALIAFSLAVPVAWYGMDKWLADFQFRITVGWGIFAVSILSGLVIAVLTVSYHGIKASLVNPAETLKYE